MCKNSDLRNINSNTVTNKTSTAKIDRRAKWNVGDWTECSDDECFTWNTCKSMLQAQEVRLSFERKRLKILIKVLPIQLEELFFYCLYINFSHNLERLYIA
jgi:hypothetical protein